MPIPQSDLIGDLERAFEQGTLDSRLAALWYATDTLLTGRYSEDQVWLFGEVIDRLAMELELTARAQLANRLCQSNNAPFQTVKILAFDDAIVVAGPILKNSQRLDEQTLIQAARSKSQLHLCAIAGRKSVSEAVTDVLVKRGDQQVVRSVVDNEGARFSEPSFFHLARRSENDSILAERVGLRRDIPRHVFLQLIAKASDEVKAKLVALSPQNKAEIDHAVSDITGDVQAKIGPATKEYFAAKRHLGKMHRRGELGEKELLEFARSKQFAETTVAFSLLCGVSVDVAERGLIGDSPEMILIMAKSAGVSWPVVQSLLRLSASGKGIAKLDMDAAFDKFSRLSVSAARKVIEFFEVRRRGATQPP